MKKLISLCLALAMCLSLAGCGKSEHAALLTMLEKGEYENAHYYIDDLKRQAAEKEKGETESIVPLLYGEWMLGSDYGNENAPETISFTEDGTCEIAGSSLKWRVTSESENYIQVSIAEGEVRKYSCSVNAEGREVILSLSQIEDEENSRGVGEYRNKALYDVIEITKDNYQDYFEMQDEGQFSENAFGEISDFYLCQYLALKKEYVTRVSSVSQLVMELKLDQGEKGCKVDMAAKTYEVQDGFKPDEYEHESSIYQFNYNGTEGEESYRAQIATGYYDEEKQLVPYYRDNMQVLRVEGKLYLLKE